MNIGTTTERIAEALRTSPIATTHELAYYTEDEWNWLTPKQSRENSKQQQRIITNATLEGLTRHAKQTVWDAGDVQYFINRFEHATVVNRSINDTTGIIVKLDTPSEHALLALLQILDTHSHSAFQSKPLDT